MGIEPVQGQKNVDKIRNKEDRYIAWQYVGNDMIIVGLEILAELHRPDF